MSAPQPFPQPPAPWAAPPGALDVSVPYNRPVWPVVLGVLSMVIGGRSLLLLLGSLLQVAYSLLLSGRSLSGSPLVGAYGAWEIVRMAELLLVPFLGAVLLLAGFALYRHHRFAPALHVAYAVPRILCALVLPVANILTCPPQIRQYFAFLTIQSATLGVIYPAFLLVWFLRPKVWRQARTWWKP